VAEPARKLILFQTSHPTPAFSLHVPYIPSALSATLPPPPPKLHYFCTYNPTTVLHSQHNSYVTVRSFCFVFRFSLHRQPFLVLFL